MTNIAHERAFLRAEGLDFITRETWGAQQSYISERDVSTPVEGFFLHISVTIDGGNTGLTEADDMRDIERIGQERFGIGFPYNMSIFDTGRLYEGQPLTRRGAHTVNDENQPGFRETGSHGSLNYWYRAIVLPQMVTDDVTDAQVHQCARWAAAQIRAGYAKRDARWYGHRDVSAKACPGDFGYARLPEIRTLTEHYVRNGLDNGGGFLMALSDAEQEELREWVRQIRTSVVPFAQDAQPSDERFQVQRLLGREFKRSGSDVREALAGTADGSVTSLLDIALRRSPTFQELVAKIDALAAAEPPVT